MSDPIQEAERRLRLGDIVVIPTDTVYGFAVDPRNPEAIRKLYEAKRRDLSKPIPLLLSDVSALENVCGALPLSARRLAERFFPGPLTLVMRLAAPLPPILNAGGETIGVRVPDHETARRLIRRLGGALAVTSANLSGKAPASKVDELDPAFDDLFILDGGPTGGVQASTVVDASREPPIILREGALPIPAVMDALRTGGRAQHKKTPRS